MKLCVDASHLIPGYTGGPEVHHIQILKQLAIRRPDFEITVMVSKEAERFGQLYQIPVREIRTGICARNKPIRFIRQQLELPLLLNRLDADVVWFPCFFAPPGVSHPAAVVIHDMRWLTDRDMFSWSASQIWRRFVPLSAQRCQAVITVSEFSKNEIIRDCHVAAERVSVIPNGAGEHEALESPVEFDFPRYKINRPYLLTVAYTHRYKNLARLILMFSKMNPMVPVQLVLAGGRGSQEEEIRDLAEASQGCVVKLGQVSTDVMKALYRHALGFVFPTLYEGFGMPILEAMRYQLPVACSDLPVLREVAGDAALYFDPLDEQSMAHAIMMLSQDVGLRERLIAKGRQRVAAYSWGRCADQHAQLFLKLSQDRP